MKSNSTAIEGRASAPCSPSSIYLQWHGDGDEPDTTPIPEDCKEFVTWCEDKVFTHDVRYVRWDLVERLLIDVMRNHSSPDNGDYNYCDEDRCQWCEWASELFPENSFIASGKTDDRVTARLMAYEKRPDLYQQWQDDQKQSHKKSDAPVKASDFEGKAKALVTAGQAKTFDEALGLVAASDPSAYTAYLSTLH